MVLTEAGADAAAVLGKRSNYRWKRKHRRVRAGTARAHVRYSGHVHLEPLRQLSDGILAIFSATHSMHWWSFKEVAFLPLTRSLLAIKKNLWIFNTKPYNDKI